MRDKRDRRPRVLLAADEATGCYFEVCLGVDEKVVPALDMRLRLIVLGYEVDSQSLSSWHGAKPAIA